MVIVKKKIEKGYFVHLQGYTLYSGRGITLTEAIGSLILNHADIFKISHRWDEKDELTRAHIKK